MRNKWVMCALAPALVAMSGCASTGPIGGAPGITITDLAALPEPEAAVSLALRPLDSVEVRVLQDSSFDGTYVLDENGNIQLPFIGAVHAASLTPADLGKTLARALSGRYVIDPQVLVRALAVIAPSVSMGGEVENPGNYPHMGSQTLMRAINAAGGRTQYARRSEVLVFRKVAGDNYIGVYDLGAIERGNYGDPPLFPGDIVMVGDSPGRRRLSGVLSILPLLTTTAILIDRLGN